MGDSENDHPLMSQLQRGDRVVLRRPLRARGGKVIHAGGAFVVHGTWGTKADLIADVRRGQHAAGLLHVPRAALRVVGHVGEEWFRDLRGRQAVDEMGQVRRRCAEENRRRVVKGVLGSSVPA